MLFSWFQKRSRKPAAGKRHRRPIRSRPHLDVLEDRIVLSFFASPTFAVGSNPVAEAKGDFRGDGRTDLVVANQQSNTVSVLLGNGDGTFQPKTDFATGVSPRGVAVADFNGDGHLDIAVANSGSKSISVLMGNGDGSFQPKIDIALPFTPLSLTVGDFNGDGKADLAIGGATATTADVAVMLGNGNGTFQAPVTTVTATVTPPVSSTFIGGAVSIQSGDFNGDGHPDLVVLNNLDTFTSIVGGRFGTQFPNFNFGTVSELLGNGDGTFQAASSFQTGESPNSLAVGEFNGDGRPDFAVNNSFGSLSVFYNTNGGNFSASSISLGANNSGPVAVGDFNGDGATDLAVPVSITSVSAGVSQTFGEMKVFNGQIGGALQPGATYALAMGSPLAADLNGDGKVDLVGTVGNAIQPWLNIGNGLLAAPSFISSSGVTFSSQATADFNGDGIPDLVTVTGGSVGFGLTPGVTGQVQLGLGDGHFGDATPLAFPTSPFPTQPTKVAAVDADGNGTVDILVSNPFYPAGQAVVWFNTPGYDDRTGGAVGFTISSPAQVAAGSNTSVTVTAVDALGNPVPGFLGTVDLDFTPAGSTALNLLSQYTFTAADNGRHTFLISNLTQVDSGTLSLFAAGMATKTAPVTVVPGALSQFVFSAPATTPAGTPFSFTITAEDKFGNVETGYTGTVHFSALANDTQAVLPADFTFTAADGGTHTFTATLTKSAGATSPFIAATDVATGASSSAKIVVNPLAAVNLSMSVASTTPTGIPTSVVVSAVDRFGNVAPGYTGTVHFASSDPQAVLPADYTFTATDAGSHTFTPTLKTAGTQTLSVTDTANPAFSSQAQISAITVVPASFEFFELPTTTAGAAYSFTMVALDAAGSLLTGYTGTVHLSSSDAQAGLPADYTFTAADGGIHTFTVTLKTAGTQTVSVTDTAHPSLTNSLSVSVAPGAVDHFVISGPTTVTQGVGFKITVSAVDAFGNVVTGYRGAVHLSSTDPTGGTQNFTFSNNDKGVHIFSYTFNALDLQTIAITDQNNSAIVGSIVENVVPKK
jgi:hypothetical protein